MKSSNEYDAVIIGGSYAGLSAAMALGRALRKVLVIDSGSPCNQKTPHSHNFLTQDGKEPAQILKEAKDQVAAYDRITFITVLAVGAAKVKSDFQVRTHSGETFVAKKLLFAAGLKDIMPPIEGFADCWGISIIHCPYCHGYEVRNEKTGIISNGDDAAHFVPLIFNWTKELTLFTNGQSTLSDEQTQMLQHRRIEIIETEIGRIDHNAGYIQNIVLKDGTTVALNAVYARPQFAQHCGIPEALGCTVTGQGLIEVNTFQKTNVPGVYACGDSSNGRAVAVAVASGMMAGAALNNELAQEEFGDLTNNKNEK